MLGLVQLGKVDGILTLLATKSTFEVVHKVSDPGVNNNLCSKEVLLWLFYHRPTDTFGKLISSFLGDLQIW